DDDDHQLDQAEAPHVPRVQPAARPVSRCVHSFLLAYLIWRQEPRARSKAPRSRRLSTLPDVPLAILYSLSPAPITAGVRMMPSRERTPLTTAASSSLPSSSASTTTSSSLSMSPSSVMSSGESARRAPL